MKLEYQTPPPPPHTRFSFSRLENSGLNLTILTRFLHVRTRT